ncbi:CPBP family intramembrane glutamic endopeptidase [Bacillus sp. IBL03825]|uniref:CPBP family intramembrane glutamic endopeptidase n=1 Tax=Bacillus sp. IBL03825 TaxID=2953580 RepID=UPI0021576C5A|nr:CPBP family intramembrane glutamic endopeptidase [Bacillus sp. IBL03825]MCR6850511.1 CPBP family intramembrane metalloprotease [Bacillus sp. IBL03825]
MTNLQDQNFITWKQFISGSLIISIIVPIVIGISLRIVFSLNFIQQAYNNNTLKISENFLLDLFILLFTIGFILTYKPFYNLVLYTLNIEPLKQGKTYLYILIATISTILLDKTTNLLPNDSGNIQATTLGLDTLSEQSTLIYAIAMLSFILLGPVFEEIFYHGIILRFLEVKHTFLIGLIVSSFLFGLAHSYDFIFVIFATLTAIIDGLLYKKTRSIITVLFGHIIYNLYVFI